MSLTYSRPDRNFLTFLWHALFLAFAQNFMDVDTVIPALVIEAGGSPMHIGIVAAIMMGGSSFTQLLFAPFLSGIPYKKNYLLIGINLRILSLFALAAILYWFAVHRSLNILWSIILFISLFSFSGAFTNISYVDILGKSIHQEQRKSFFSARQIIGGIIILSTAILAREVLLSTSFPGNYSVMFLIGAVALLTASGGFWRIRESKPSGVRISGISAYLNMMYSEIRSNKRMVYFLGFINTQGIVISFIPFIMLYAKETFKTQAVDTGTFLVFKIIGAVAVSLLVLLSSKSIKYNILLFSNVFLSVALGFSAILISDVSSLKFLFFLGGIAVSLYAITMNGVLLEISGIENRALYAGFAGAGNIVPAIFPLISGHIISSLGYKVFFLIFAAVISFSLLFIYKLNCSR